MSSVDWTIVVCLGCIKTPLVALYDGAAHVDSVFCMESASLYIMFVDYNKDFLFNKRII